jgi:replicative DNA helicase Mcm
MEPHSNASSGADDTLAASSLPSRSYSAGPLDGGGEVISIASATAAPALQDSLVRQWESFFKDHMKPLVNDAAIGYPERRSVTVDFRELDRYAKDLAEDLLKRPTQALWLAQEALKNVDVAVEPRPRLRVRVENLHVEGGADHSTVAVRSLRAEHLGRLIAIKGMVKRITEVRPQLASAAFKCRRCGAIITEEQDEHLTLREPVECYEDQSGCGATGSFRLMLDPFEAKGATFEDTQKIEVEEAPEGLRGGEQPQRLSAWVDEDLCNKVAPGDRVVLTGVLRANVKKQGGVKSSRLDLYFQAVGITTERKDYDDIQISPDEQAEIIRLSRDPDLYHKLRDSLAPDIYGLEIEKEALLLQLFGGLPKRLQDGGRLRGDLHVLFVGDPGVAKSQLIRTSARLAPRGIYTSGQSTSAAGLTAAAVQDDSFGEGRWTLEAGAMVLADKGLCAIDEIDKMRKEDRSAMHESLEQQTVSIAKAGLTATLQSRCAVVAAANPKTGRFDPNVAFGDQIDLPPPLLSRFDLIFVLTDRPDASRDTALASAILDVHRGNAMLELLDAKPEAIVDQADLQQALRRSTPPVERELFRKYVAFAKREVFPVISKEAAAFIRDYYVRLRRGSGGEDAGHVPLTARQLEAIVRLAEASARARLSDVAAIEDAERAQRLVETYLRRLNPTEDGRIDSDVVSVGASQNAQQRMRTLIEVIRELSLEDDRHRSAAMADILEKAQSRGVPNDKARELINRMKQQGQLMEPQADRFRVVRE